MSDPPLSPSRRWWALAVLILIQATVVFNATLLLLVSPIADYGLHFSYTAVLWVATTFALTFGSLMVLGGALGDLWGRRTTLFVGLVGFVIASTLAGAASDYTMFIIAVALQGVFSALLTPTTLATVATLFTDQTDRAKGFAAYGTVAGSGVALALLVGGVFLDWTSWRGCFFLGAALAALAIAGVANFVDEGVARTERRADRVGVTLVTGGLVLVIFALNHAVKSQFSLFTILGWSVQTTSRWRNLYSWGPLVLGVALGALAIRRHRSRRALSSRIATRRPLLGSLTALVLVSAATVQVILMLADYLQENLAGSPAHVGADFLPLVLTTLLSAYFASARLLASTGPRPLVPTGMILATMAMVLFTRLTPFADYWGHVFPGLILLGLGLGLIVAPAFASAMSALANTSVDAALVTTTTWLAGAVGTAVLSTVVGRVALRSFLVTSGNSVTIEEIATVHALSVAFWWSAILLIVGAVSTFFLLSSGAAESPEAP